MIRISYALFLNVQEGSNYPAHEDVLQERIEFRGGGVGIEKSIPRGGGGGVCIEKSIRRGGVELNYQLLDPDAPTLASQDKL